MEEPIMIDGVDVSECKCLHNVKVITELAQPEDFEILCGATNGAIKCEKWKDCYFKQLTRKTQECEELENKIKKLRKNLALEIGINGRYRKALEEIEKIVSKNYYDDTWADISIKLDDILNIINNAKGEGKCQ